MTRLEAHARHSKLSVKLLEMIINANDEGLVKLINGSKAISPDHQQYDNAVEVIKAAEREQGFRTAKK